MPDIVAHVWNPSTLEAEAEELFCEVEISLGYYSKFQVSLGYGVKPCLRRKKIEKKNNNNNNKEEEVKDGSTHESYS